MSFYVSVSRTLIFFILSLYGFEGVFYSVSCGRKEKFSMI
jgi:hypothetical protein